MLWLSQSFKNLFLCVIPLLAEFLTFYVVTLRRGRPRPREQLLLQNYKA